MEKIKHKIEKRNHKIGKRKHKLKKEGPIGSGNPKVNASNQKLHPYQITNPLLARDRAGIAPPTGQSAGADCFKLWFVLF